MSKSQKFFRYLWRVNAVLILVAAGAVTLGVGGLLAAQFGTRSAIRREAELGPAVAGPQADPRLVLGQASRVPGSQVLRAQLILSRAEGSFSSGGYSEVRNILFIEPGDVTARWLLPDNDHVIAESPDVMADENDPKARHTLATAALVKPTRNPEESSGRLLLFDPTGRKVLEVADGVRKLHVVTYASGEMSLLYERDRHLVLAQVDPASFTKRKEREVDVPQLK
jgi:hypothetical protein